MLKAPNRQVSKTGKSSRSTSSLCKSIRCYCYLVWLVFEGSIPTCNCFCSENLLWLVKLKQGEGEGCDTLLMSAVSSKAHFATSGSPCLELCTPQSLTMPTKTYCLCEAYSACAYTCTVFVNLYQRLCGQLTYGSSLAPLKQYAI